MKKRVIESWISTILGTLILLLSNYFFFFSEELSMWTYLMVSVFGMVLIYADEKRVKQLFNYLFKLDK